MISYSDTALTISEPLQTNAVVWIHSLPEQEMGPSRRILEDLEGLSTAGGFPVFEYAVRDRSELSELFSQLTTKAEQGLRPVLHVDAHGTIDEGLLLAPSGERVGWAEIIEDLRALNVAAANNLTCIFALCFGLHLYKQVSLRRPVPSYLFFAPPAEISVGFLEAQTLDFYREMNRTSNVTAAFEQTLGGVMQSFHCQGLFLQSLLRYIRTYCIGRMRQDRLERMVTAVLQRDGIANPSGAQLKQVRRKIRESLKPGQKVIDLFAPSFLIGRAPAFTYADLDRILKRSVRSERSQRRSASS
ncbi:MULTISPECIES: hypothetical protein [unclassified Mesorhizobium]|uniref:hypothetical protein n=1 Tax=unclassified Mesorhizobium TaxID=325217 RepID=UPI0010941480|nr:MULTISPECIES: hypothetical protein [unclassified Mesorhizobium]TGQ77335.1 hypothetical protein EN850_28750 [Mesorhizobium sp. M8A.F.Ca.ET.207.01.1.1]TGS39089.1 hypothetical protein EN825_28455 [Mesorhizobium sp. M8A.F.Ca.ET.182.01.1.1]TGS77370.1 hypothetical protein EN824_28690 [Mesorhizobium sp. M8A.F.Ca.ET.181.01.1.1]TGT36274.1 hypothetical protein EN808_28495 [Mesorhizobium sp. M8A.F.Ca.ET.165.01.1.1]